MTQGNDAPSEETAPARAGDENRSADTSLGQKLRDAREQRSLLLEQVAESLHLDETVITALEQGNFSTLGAPVYVRGHLKTYARLLGLSPDTIAAEYHGTGSTLVTSMTLQQPGTAPVTVNPVLWAGGALAVFLGLLLGIYVLLGNDGRGDTIAAQSSDDTAVGAAIVSSPPIDTAVVPSDVPRPDERRVVITPQPADEEPVATIEAEIVAAAAQPARSPVEAPTPRPVATMRLGLQFNQESWVEISDARRRLLFGLQRQGNRREITGEPPFNLLIGNARGVELTINDEPFAVPASGVRGKIARFEITGEELE